MSTNVLKPAPLPASIQAYVDACSKRIYAAAEVVKQVGRDRKDALDAYYNLVGKTVVYTAEEGFDYGKKRVRVRTYRVLIKHVYYEPNGTINYMVGFVQPKGGGPGYASKEIYASAIRDGRVELVDEVAS